jgi:hypothetical protein
MALIRQNDPPPKKKMPHPLPPEKTQKHPKHKKTPSYSEKKPGQSYGRLFMKNAMCVCVFGRVFLSTRWLA